MTGFTEFQSAWNLTLAKELSSLLPVPFRLLPSPLFPEAIVSFGTLSVCLPLGTPLHVGFLSFLTLGNWSSFHNIAPNPDVWSSHHLINMKFYSCLQLWIINSASFLCFQSLSWSYKAITIKNWAAFCNFDLYNPSKFISEGISLTDNSAWSHLTSSLCKLTMKKSESPCTAS